MTEINEKVTSDTITIDVYKKDNITFKRRVTYNVKGYDIILNLLNDLKLEVQKNGDTYTLDPITTQ